jgi:hypothetical protein
MNIVESIETFEQKLREEGSNKRDCYRRLGHQKSLCGLARAGLEDSLRAYALATPRPPDPMQLDRETLKTLRRYLEDPDFPVAGPSFAELVQLAESLRCHARDLDISSVEESVERTKWMIERSLRCFDAGIAFKDGRSDDQLGWAHAHRGAAYTTLYWIEHALNRDSAEKSRLFRAAQDDFRKAVELRKNNVWAIQFEAFLLTIRGAREDFEAAGALLERAKAEGAASTTSMDRSLAILNFNLGGADPRNEYDRLKASVGHGLAAMQKDTEECPAAFFSVASMALLAKAGHPKSFIYDKAVHPAIQSARTRATNIISQAAATLVGLEAIETYLRAKPCDKHGKRRYRKWLDIAREVPPDLESRVVYDHAVRQLLVMLGDTDTDLRKELEEFLQAFSH